MLFLRRCLSVLSLLTYLGGLPPSGYAQEGMHPLLPLTVAYDPQFLFEAAFLDPGLPYHDFSNDQINRIKAKMHRHFANRSTLLQSAAAPALRDAFADTLYLYHYLVQRKQGLAPHYNIGLSGPDAPAQVRTLLITLGERLLVLSTLRSEQERLRFQLALLHTLNNKSTAPLHEAWTELEHSGLSRQRKNLLSFALLLSELHHEEPARQQQARIKLERLSLSLDRNTNTLLNLLLAEHVASQSSDLVAANQHLDVVARLCHSFTPAQKTQSFASLVNLWLKVKRPSSDDWTLPFASSCYEGTELFQAILERQALTHLAGGKYSAALALMTRVEAAVSDQALQVALSQRTLDIARRQYERDGDATAMQNHLLAALGRYEGRPYHTQLTQELQQFTLHQVQEGCYQAHATPIMLAGCSALVAAYLPHEPDETAAHRVRAALAAAYEVAKQHEHAAQLYKALADEGHGAAKKKHLQAALRNQAAHAEWPLSEPWRNAAAPSPARQTLQAYVGEGLTLCQADECSDLTAHWGVLACQAGQWEQATSLWLDFSRKDPKTLQVPFILGYLMTAATQAGRFAEVERAGLFISDEKAILAPLVVTPQGTRAIDVGALLEKALAYNAQAAVDARHYAEATPKLQALLKRFPQSPARASYLALLAASYQHLGDFRARRQILEELVNLGPATGSYHPQAITELADLYHGSGRLHEAARLLDSYHPLLCGQNMALCESPGKGTSAKDGEGYRLTWQLIADHTALGNAEKALQLLARLKPARLPAADQARWYDRHLVLYRQLGAHDRLIAFAEANLQAPAPLPTRLHLAQILADHAFKQSDLPALRKLESVLDQAPYRQAAASPLRQYLWFLQMKVIAPALVKASAETPLPRSASAELKALRSSYEHAKVGYASLCRRENEGFLCSAALQATLELLPLLREHSVNLTKRLAVPHQAQQAPAALAELEATRQYLVAESTSLEERLRARSNGAESLPSLVNPVLWAARSDWNFTTSPSLGSGFMQLSTARVLPEQAKRAIH